MRAWVDHWAVASGYGGNGEMVPGLLDLAFQCYASEMGMCIIKLVYMLIL